MSACPATSGRTASRSGSPTWSPRRCSSGRPPTTTLLSNAIRFTPEGGRVGIEASVLPRIFERFRPGEAGSTRRSAGLGRGLLIVRHLVELHGGVVRAASPGVGRGATLTVELPLLTTAAGASPARGPAPSAPDTRALEHVRILLVDDDDDARDLLAMVLRAHGAEVAGAPSAEDAVSAFARAVPDIVLSDIGLPDTDGYGLLRQLHRLAAPGTPSVIGVALTAWARAEDRDAALDAGFQAHVVKPIDPIRLVAQLATLVQEHRLAGITGTGIAGS